MPMFASTPSALAVDSSDSPASAATGATYFIDSPRSSSVCAELLAVAVSTSATRPVSLASSPNARSVAPAISAACARSVPVARASASIIGVAAAISSVEKPARASESIPPPTSDAV